MFECTVKPAVCVSDIACYSSGVAVTRSKRVLPALWAVLACGLLLLAMALPSAAQTKRVVTLFTDTNSTDSNGVPGMGAGVSGDLRYALNHAIAAGGSQIIVFPSTCTKANPCTITLSNPLPPILGTSSNSLTLVIDGGANGSVVLDGAGKCRIFFVDAHATVTLANLVIQNALAQGGAGGSADLNCVTGGGGGMAFAGAPGAGGGLSGGGGGILAAGSTENTAQTVLAGGGNGERRHQ